ncbi:MAG: hypothetical protein LUH63_12270 [Parabacteroides sp.]|nr:hypothetical protein [Parabacteroides sp.]
MRKIKLWFNWFSAKDAQTLAKNYSGLKPVLKTIAKHAKEGGRECFAYCITSEDVDKLVRLGYSVELYSSKVVNGNVLYKYLIKW